MIYEIDEISLVFKVSAFVANKLRLNALSPI